MVIEEIQHLKNTLHKKIFNKNCPVWKKAFIEYTLDTKIPLGMGCSNCYLKVFNYLINKSSESSC